MPLEIDIPTSDIFYDATPQNLPYRAAQQKFQEFIHIHLHIPITELFSAQSLFRRTDPFGV
jgi:hypothetical protein